MDFHILLVKLKGFLEFLDRPVCLPLLNKLLGARYDLIFIFSHLACKPQPHFILI